jgi:hypothetical protein
MTEQPHLFEGYKIERQQANITFDIETEDERFFTVDQPVVLVVVAQVDVPRFGRTKDGGLKRVNKLNAVVARFADGVMRDEVVEMFHLDDPGEALFYTPPTPRPAPPVADPETGEMPPPRERDTTLEAFLHEPREQTG